MVSCSLFEESNQILDELLQPAPKPLVMAET